MLRERGHKAKLNTYKINNLFSFFFPLLLLIGLLFHDASTKELIKEFYLPRGIKFKAQMDAQAQMAFIELDIS